MLQKYFSYTEFQKFYDCENIEAGGYFTALGWKTILSAKQIEPLTTSCMKREEDLMIRDDEHKTCWMINRISGALLRNN